MGVRNTMKTANHLCEFLGLIGVVGAVALSGCAPAGEMGEEATALKRSALDFSGWSSVDLESTPVSPAGTLVSAGKGVATPTIRHVVGDRVRFLYQNIEDENAEIVIKLDGLTATPGASPPQGQVGVMIRDGLGANAQMVAGYWERNSYTGNGLVMNKFRVTWREARAPSDVAGVRYTEFDGVGQTPTWADPGPDPDVNVDPPAEFYSPIWLRLQRAGSGVALSRSFDGSTWSPMAHSAGGAGFSPSGPVYLGIFVAGFDPPNDPSGGNSPTTTTADINDVQIRQGAEVDYGYRTSWIGGTESRSQIAFTPGILSALYVAPDGTAYTYGQSEWNSRRRGIHDASTGLLRPTALQVGSDFAEGAGAAQNAFTGDGTWVYYVRRTASGGFCVERRVAIDLGRVGTEATCTREADSVTKGSAGGAAEPRAGGAAAHVGEAGLRVYVSDFANAVVHVFGEPPPGSSQLVRLSSFPAPAGRPGAVAVDKRGKVWVVHSATPYGSVGSYDKEPGATPSIKGYDPETNAEIATIEACPAQPQNATNCPPPDAGSNCVTNPTALAYDGFGSRDRLLVGENGPSQNIHFFCSLDAGSPVRCAPAHFGQEGGVFCGTPGKVSDGGSDARFHAISGVGVDEGGGIYVASAAPYYDVRKYLPDGTRAWWNQGLALQALDFDPATDGQDVYSARHHFKLNLGDSGDPLRDISSPQYSSGMEWSLEGVTWEPFPDPLAGTIAYTERDEHGATARRSGVPLVRNISGNRYLFVESSEPGDYGADGKALLQFVKIYRFVGERAVPCGEIRATQFCGWGNGPNQAEEDLARAACAANPSCICNSVPGNGTVENAVVLSIWNDTNGNGLEDEALLETLSPADFDEMTGQWTPEMIANPPPFGMFNFDVDSEGDIWLSFGSDSETEVDNELMRAAIWRLARDPNSSQLAYSLPSAAERKEYALGPLGIGGKAIRFQREPHQSMFVHGGNAIHRIDGFLTSARALEVSIALPAVPAQAAVVRSDFTSYGTTWHTPAFDVAGDKVFVGERLGVVYVFDADTGGFVTKLFANADVSGIQTQNDVNLRAFRRLNGEYLVTTNDTGGHGRAFLFRWKPPGECAADENCQGANHFCDAGTCRARSCSLSDPFGSMSPVLASGLGADGIAIAPNGLSAVISSKAGADYDLYTVARGSVSEAFDTPVALTSVNSGTDERAPWLSTDGRRLYFHRPGSVGDTDLFVAERSALTAEFGTPALVPGVNSTATDEAPFLRPDEDTLFFSSSRGSGTDLYVSNASNGVFAAPTLLAVVNSSVYADTRPVLRRDGLALYFQSQRSGVGNDNDGDIWLAQRASTGANFDGPTNVSLLNTSGIDFPVSLSADGCSLYLASNRETGLGSTQSFRLYRAQRQASPSQVAVTVNVVGSGSVGSPFNCTSNGGTCTAERTFGDSLVVWASNSAIWSGNCGPNGTGLSSDGIVPFTLNSTCTVTFP